MVSRLPVALAPVQADNTSKKKAKWNMLSYILCIEKKRLLKSR